MAMIMALPDIGEMVHRKGREVIAAAARLEQDRDDWRDTNWQIPHIKRLEDRLALWQDYAKAQQAHYRAGGSPDRHDTGEWCDAAYEALIQAGEDVE